MSGAGSLSVYRAQPDRLAVVTDEAELDYRHLAARVAGAERRIAAEGLRPETRVGVVAEARLDHLVGLSAMLERGLVPVLLHPRLPAATRAVLGARAAAETELDLTWVGEATPAASPPPPAPSRDPEADLAVFFTSGSSGLPKGVRLSRRAFEASASASAANLGWQENDRWLLGLPLAHIGGFSVLTRTRLASRAVVLPGREERFEPAAWTDRVERHQVRLASVVPTMLRRLVESGRAAPASLRAVLVGGAPASPELLAAARRLGWPVLATYGMTEACSQVSCQRPGDPPGDDAGVVLGTVSIRVSEGELQLQGPTLTSGYLPEDLDRWTEDGWFRTGDVGSVHPDGRVRVRGRLTDMVVTGGENVSPARVEAALESLAEIRRAVVVGLPDPEWGEAVVAAVELGLGEPPSLDAVRRRLRSTLARFEVPKRVVVVDALPTLPSGKLDRRAVRAWLAAAGNAEVPRELH